MGASSLCRLGSFDLLDCLIIGVGAFLAEYHCLSVLKLLPQPQNLEARDGTIGSRQTFGFDSRNDEKMHG